MPEAGFLDRSDSIIYPPLVPIRIFESLEAKAIIFGLFEGVFINLDKTIFLSIVRLFVQITILPPTSPEIIPPLEVYVKALTALVCYLYGFVQLLPFQTRIVPFCIPLTNPFPYRAKLNAATTGVLPNIPFVPLNFPFLKSTNITYLAHEAATVSSLSLNFRQ